MQVLPLKSGNVPAELKAYDSWLLWKLEKGTTPKADGSEKWLKVPYYANGRKRRGELGEAKDLANLVSYTDALKAYRANPDRYTGIGFATMPDYPITILDLDDCIDRETGEYSTFANEVIATGTYVERSPSGFGLRAVFSGGAVVAGKRNGVIENGERVEIYCGGAFVTVTGHRVSDGQTRDLPKKLRRMLEPVIAGNGLRGSNTAPQRVDGDLLMPIEAAPIADLTLEHARVILNKLPAEWGQPGHGTWYRAAAALHLQFNGSEGAYQVLDEWSQGLDGYDADANRKRWDAGFSHDAGRGGITTFKNLVFEAVQKGGLKVKKETMQKWGLARKAEDDFDIDPDEDDSVGLPELSDFMAMGNIGEMVDTPAPEIDWLVEDMIPRGQVSFLGGGSGTSKSFLVMQMCMYAAGGVVEGFAGLRFCEGGFKTLYLAYEDARAMAHGRVENISRHINDGYDILGDGEYREALKKNLFIVPSEVLDDDQYRMAQKKGKFDALEVTKLRDYLCEISKKYGIDMIVFDTGSETHTGDENNAGDMVTLMRALRVLATSANVAVLVVQHVAKNIWSMKLEEMNQASIRGSSVLVDKARNVFMLARMPRADAEKYGLPNEADTHENYIALKHVKANMGGYLPIKVFMRTNRGLLVYRQDIQEVDSGLTPIDDKWGERRVAAHDKLRQTILDYITRMNEDGEYPYTGRVVKDLIEHANEQKIRAVLRSLEDEKAVEKVYNPEHPKSNHWKVIPTSK